MTLESLSEEESQWAPEGRSSRMVFAGALLLLQACPLLCLSLTHTHTHTHTHRHTLLHTHTLLHAHTLFLRKHLSRKDVWSSSSPPAHLG